ncbi:TetR/AcrR family transcriptional regulator [Paenibacillus sp. NPDC058071]|uniref:TetR/AcrR family transcriptional regulator n=1 Tax=Paenibacillus sp. NPDC058071 TaxID=3346326 RepID=UPI0036DA4C9B
MSPRNFEKDKELRAERRQQLLEAAMHVIARRGLPATKIADIAAAAKMSVGSIYNYFRSKEEIFQALVENGQQEYRTFVEEALSLESTPYEKLHWYTSNWLVYRNGWAITVLLQYARTSEAVPAELTQAVSSRFIDNLRPMASIIAEGQQAGVFKDGDSTQLALIYVSMMEGLILHDIPGIHEIAALTPDRMLSLLLK